MKEGIYSFTAEMTRRATSVQNTNSGIDSVSEGQSLLGSSSAPVVLYDTEAMSLTVPEDDHSGLALDSLMAKTGSFR